MTWEESLFVGAAVGVFLVPIAAKRIDAWRDKRRVHKLQEGARVALLAQADRLIEFGRSMGADDDDEFGPSEIVPRRKGWQRPVPHGAKSLPWEDLHVFVEGGRPKRDPYMGLVGHEPPLSFRCVICEADQEPFHFSGETRRCIYCGLAYKAHGTRVFWWREPVTATVEWRT